MVLTHFLMLWPTPFSRSDHPIVPMFHLQPYFNPLFQDNGQILNKRLEWDGHVSYQPISKLQSLLSLNLTAQSSPVKIIILIEFQ